MFKVISGTTPAFKFTFSSVDPGDIVTAIMTVKDKEGNLKVRRELDTATVGSNYISWTLTQEETLSFGEKVVYVMVNWITRFNVRGASKEEVVKGVKNHIEEVINDGSSS